MCNIIHAVVSVNLVTHLLNHAIAGTNHHIVVRILEIEGRIVVPIKRERAIATQLGCLVGFNFGCVVAHRAVGSDVVLFALTLINANVIDLHHLVATVQGCNIVGVVNARNRAAHSHVEQQEETLVEVVARRVALRKIVDVHLKVRLSIGILVEVEIHRNLLVVPDEGVEMELAILHAIRSCVVLRVHGVVAIGVGTPMQCTGKVAVLNTIVDTSAATGLHHIDFTAIRPRNALAQIVAHEPESRPQTIGSAGKLNAGFNLAMLESSLAHGVNTTRGKLLAQVTLPLGSDVEHAIGNSDIAGGIILQLAIAATIAIDLNIPNLGVKRGSIKLIAEDELIVGSGCHGVECHESSGCQKSKCFFHFVEEYYRLKKVDRDCCERKCCKFIIIKNVRQVSSPIKNSQKTHFFLKFHHAHQYNILNTNTLQTHRHFTQTHHMKIHKNA